MLHSVATTIVLATASCLASLSLADLQVIDVFRGNPHPKTNDEDCVSWWCPMLASTNSNTTLLWGCCKTGIRGKVLFRMTRSTDAGHSWAQPTAAPYLGQTVYSRRTSTLYMTCAAEVNASTQLPVTLRRGTPPANPYQTAWAHELHRVSAAQLAKCETSLTLSTDDGQTFASPQLLSVNNSLGPHYTGYGLNHGIEIQWGPHAGRLALARRFDCPSGGVGGRNSPEYLRSFVLYSDDSGAHWTAGQLLPQGWTECQIAEMRNGSLLMTSRMVGSPYLTTPPKRTNLRRGFARSDDGGYTWSEIWYLEDRQPEIMVGTCAHALVSDTVDPSSPRLYYSHPGNWSYGLELARANYSLHTTDDSGATWGPAMEVYAHGAGYSDAYVVPSEGEPAGRTLLMAFQRTFEPPVKGIEGGGYNLALARAPLPLRTNSYGMRP